MRSSKHPTPLSVILFTLGSVSACGLLQIRHPVPVRISKYRREGTISRIKFLPNQGVNVDFAWFSLGSPYSAVYRLDGLPRPRTSPYMLGLVVDLRIEEREILPQRLKGRRVGRVVLVVRDGLGQILTESEGAVEDFHWKWLAPEWDGVAVPFGMLPHEMETADSQRPLLPRELFGKPPRVPGTLEVDYFPGPEAPETLRAKARLTAGGYT